MIAALWVDACDLMTDLWTFHWIYNHKLTHAEKAQKYSPLIDVNFFRRCEPIAARQFDGKGVSTGNTLVMLGREEEHRRKMMEKGLTLKQYLQKRPELPAWLSLGEDFYIVE